MPVLKDIYGVRERLVMGLWLSPSGIWQEDISGLLEEPTITAVGTDQIAS